jgi:hypothetical protein
MTDIVEPRAREPRDDGVGKCRAACTNAFPTRLCICAGSQNSQSAEPKTLS